MKKWIIRIICLIAVLCPCVVNANFMSISATEMDVEISNIDDDIKTIWLVVYDDKASVKEAYKNSDMDFTNARSYDQHYASFDDEVDPYSKEDYVFNTNYDKKNYIVDTYFSYEYEIENFYSFSDGSVGKFKSQEDLLNYGNRHGMHMFDEETIQNIKDGKLKCTRSASYSAYRLVDVKELTDYRIVNHTLNYSISDFSTLNTYRSSDLNAGYAFRFETKEGNYKTIKLGSNDILYEGKRPSNLVKTVRYDYSSGKKADNSIDYYAKKLVNAIIHILVALVITISVELLVAKLMNIKSYVIVGIVNLVTQIALHLFTYAIIPIIFNSVATNMPFVILAAEALIVLVDYGLYKLFIKNQTGSKLMIYSLSANCVSFGISILLYILLKF